MSTYQAPLADMQFVLNELAGIDAVGKLPGFEEATPDVVAAILEEAGKFATNILDPIEAWWRRHGKPDPYPAGGWGPASSDRMLARDGRVWRKP